jgi:hypothetical protein
MILSSANFVRLLAALEDLAAQESFQLAGEDYNAVRRTQARAEPLIAELVRFGGSAVTSDIRPRLEALLARRQRNQDHLNAQVANVRDALVRTEASRRRIDQIAPAYGVRPSRRKRAVA